MSRAASVDGSGAVRPSEATRGSGRADGAPEPQNATERPDHAIATWAEMRRRANAAFPGCAIEHHGDELVIFTGRVQVGEDAYGCKWGDA